MNRTILSSSEGYEGKWHLKEVQFAYNIINKTIGKNPYELFLGYVPHNKYLFSRNEIEADIKTDENVNDILRLRHK